MLELTTPALLFPAISLLLLAYNQRFLTLASRVRDLAGDYEREHTEKVRQQIDNFRLRLRLIRWMQALGVVSFFLCVVTMLMLFVDSIAVAKVLFGVSLGMLAASLALALAEVNVSGRAIDVLLSEMEEPDHSDPFR